MLPNDWFDVHSHFLVRFLLRLPHALNALIQRHPLHLRELRRFAVQTFQVYKFHGIGWTLYIEILQTLTVVRPTLSFLTTHLRCTHTRRHSLRQTITLLGYSFLFFEESKDIPVSSYSSLVAASAVVSFGSIPPWGKFQDPLFPARSPTKTCEPESLKTMAHAHLRYFFPSTMAVFSGLYPLLLLPSCPLSVVVSSLSSSLSVTRTNDSSSFQSDEDDDNKNRKTNGNNTKQQR